MLSIRRKKCRLSSRTRLLMMIKVIADAVEVAKKFRLMKKLKKEAIEQAVKDLNEANANWCKCTKVLDDAGAGGKSTDDKSSGATKKSKKGKKDKDEPIEGEVVND